MASTQTSAYSAPAIISRSRWRTSSLRSQCFATTSWSSRQLFWDSRISSAALGSFARERNADSPEDGAGQVRLAQLGPDGRRFAWICAGWHRLAQVGADFAQTYAHLPRLAQTGAGWLRFAQVGLRWPGLPRLVQVGPRLAQNGSDWRRLAQICTAWHRMAQICVY